MKNKATELALKLKKAGFSQNGAKEAFCLECNKHKDKNCLDMQHKTEYVVCPSLEDLLYSFSPSTILQIVIATDNVVANEMNTGTVRIGATPFGALVDLWIALYKK